MLQILLEISIFCPLHPLLFNNAKLLNCTHSSRTKKIQTKLNNLNTICKYIYQSIYTISKFTSKCINSGIQFLPHSLGQHPSNTTTCNATSSHIIWIYNDHNDYNYSSDCYCGAVFVWNSDRCALFHRMDTSAPETCVDIVYTRFDEDTVCRRKSRLCCGGRQWGGRHRTGRCPFRISQVSAFIGHHCRYTTIYICILTHPLPLA